LFLLGEHLREEYRRVDCFCSVSTCGRNTGGVFGDDGHLRGSRCPSGQPTATRHTGIHTYLPTYLPTCIDTYYLPTHLPTYLPTYLSTFTHTYLRTYVPT